MNKHQKEIFSPHQAKEALEAMQKKGLVITDGKDNWWLTPLGRKLAESFEQPKQ